MKASTPKKDKIRRTAMPTVWSTLEDMALMEPDTSPEYITLLQEKGWMEISNRKKFLQVRPVLEQ